MHIIDSHKNRNNDDKTNSCAIKYSIPILGNHNPGFNNINKIHQKATDDKTVLVQISDNVKNLQRMNYLVQIVHLSNYTDKHDHGKYPCLRIY